MGLHFVVHVDSLTPHRSKFFQNVKFFLTKTAWSNTTKKKYMSRSRNHAQLSADSAYRRPHYAERFFTKKIPNHVPSVAILEMNGIYFTHAYHTTKRCPTHRTNAPHTPHINLLIYTKPRGKPSRKLHKTLLQWVYFAVAWKKCCRFACNTKIFFLFLWNLLRTRISRPQKMSTAPYPRSTHPTQQFADLHKTTW